jgi:F-type H+-transporting ATPase subunit alpha
MNRLIDKLAQYGAMDYTSIVFTGAADAATLQFFAPYSGCTLGE